MNDLILEYRHKQLISFGGILLCILMMMIGAFSNFTVILANENRMPVKTQYFIDTNKHFSFENETEIFLYKLSDRYTVNLPNKYYIIFSIGDVFILLSAVLSIWLIVDFSILDFKLKKMKGGKRNGRKQ